jgi:hypothetical protein
LGYLYAFFEFFLCTSCAKSSLLLIYSFADFKKKIVLDSYDFDSKIYL